MIKYDLKDQQFLAVVRNTILYVWVTGLGMLLFCPQIAWKPNKFENFVAHLHFTTRIDFPDKIKTLHSNLVGSNQRLFFQQYETFML